VKNRKRNIALLCNLKYCFKIFFEWVCYWIYCKQLSTENILLVSNNALSGPLDFTPYVFVYYTYIIQRRTITCVIVFLQMVTGCLEARALQLTSRQPFCYGDSTWSAFCHDLRLRKRIRKLPNTGNDCWAKTLSEKHFLWLRKFHPCILNLRLKGMRKLRSK